MNGIIETGVWWIKEGALKKSSGDEPEMELGITEGQRKRKDGETRTEVREERAQTRGGRVSASPIQITRQAEPR